jgi:hypothetical protein
MTHELDYEIPLRPFTITWIAAACVLAIFGLWHTRPLAWLLFVTIVLVWVNFCSTVIHYALDAEEFTRWPVIGRAFIRFQSHHFPQWIKVIYQKPALDLVGELNPFAVVNLISPLLLFRMRSREVFVAWAYIMLAGSYAMLCHRWAHVPPRMRPAFAGLLQKFHLALRPEAHWRHHVLAANPGGAFVPNFDLSFGWSNAFFNRVLRWVPSQRLWLAIMALLILGQVPLLATVLRWLNR